MDLDVGGERLDGGDCREGGDEGCDFDHFLVLRVVGVLVMMGVGCLE